jgi:hypothetical protein
MQFVPSGVNEELLEAAGFRLIDQAQSGAAMKHSRF